MKYRTYRTYLKVPYGTGQIGGSGFFGSQKLKLVSTYSNHCHARTDSCGLARDALLGDMCLYLMRSTYYSNPIAKERN